MAVYLNKRSSIPSWNQRLRRFGMLLLTSATLSLSLGGNLLINPAWAGDPFRPTTPNSTIDNRTETAFSLIFHDGNYVRARQELNAAEAAGSNDPLIYAMQASMAFLDQDWAKLTSYAQKTQDKAIALAATDELRSELYQAVGIFFKGAAILKEQGIARGTPQALSMLQQVFSHIDSAEEINPNDPELNLLKGFMDLMLAVNLPFSNPEQAIERLQASAPQYVAQRGIALGYRDLEEYSNATTAVDAALQAAPNNPEIMALKAQILARQSQKADSLAWYARALTYQEQLHPRLASQLRYEHCRLEGVIDINQCFTDSGLENYQP
jgi:tetratricopeptide (TPR) repeat protein